MFFPGFCDRCSRQTSVFSCSYFNEEDICPACEEAERRSPEYERARQAELEACRRGDFNFPGIGLPSDLLPGEARAAELERLHDGEEPR